MNTKNIFFVGLIVAASGLISTPFALLAGLIYGMSFAHPYHLDAKKLSAFLLQVSIVRLGFGMNLHEVVRAGKWVRLYRAQHQLCHAARSWNWTIVQGSTHTIAPDQCGHRHLRRECDCRRWADRKRRRRGDGRVTRHRLRAEFGCLVSLSRSSAMPFTSPNLNSDCGPPSPSTTPVPWWAQPQNTAPRR